MNIFGLPSTVEIEIQPEQTLFDIWYHHGAEPGIADALPPVV